MVSSVIFSQTDSTYCCLVASHLLFVVSEKRCATIRHRTVLVQQRPPLLQPLGDLRHTSGLCIGHGSTDLEASSNLLTTVYPRARALIAVLLGYTLVTSSS